jgi:hypothetical protein
VKAVKPTKSRRKYRRLIAGVLVLAVCGFLLGVANYVFEKRGPGGKHHETLVPNAPHKATAYQELVLKPRSAAEQESLRKRARQIAVGMREDELPQVMGCEWDSRFSFTDSSSEEKVIAWDTGGLGVVVLTHRVMDDGVPSRRVVCVIEGNSGYHLGTPP